MIIQNAQEIPASEYPSRRCEFDDQIILAANMFTVARFLGRGQFERRAFDTLTAALNDAWRDPRAMVYAVRADGRDALIPRDQWAHYLRARGEQK